MRNQARKRIAWRIAGVLVLIAAEAFLYGYSYPFFSLALEKRELANWLIGLNASLASAGILFVGPFLPATIRRLGLKYVVATMFAISLLSFAAILLVDHLVMWFAARFVMGTCFAALWTTTEIWLNGAVDDRSRGRIIGASGTLYAACQFLGPIVLGGVGVTGPLPLIVAMAPLAVGVAVALSISPVTASAEEESHRDGHTLKLALQLAGALVSAAFLCGIGETAMQSLLPLYGLAHGYDDSGAAGLVAIFSFGEAVMVAGLGWMADRYGRQFTLRLCVAVAALTAAALPFSVGTSFLLWPVLFLSGGTVAGIYTLGIVLIGQDFRSHTLAVVSTGFAMAYAAGCIIGAAPVGYLLDLFGPEALPLTIAVCFFALLAYLFLQREPQAELLPSRSRRLPEDDEAEALVDAFLAPDLGLDEPLLAEAPRPDKPSVPPEKSLSDEESLREMFRARAAALEARHAPGSPPETPAIEPAPPPPESAAQPSIFHPTPGSGLKLRQTPRSG